MIRCLHIPAAALLIATLIITPICWCSAQENEPLRISPAEWQPAEESSWRTSKPAPAPPSDAEVENPFADRSEAEDETAVESTLFPIESDESAESAELLDLPSLIEIAHSNSPALRKLEARVEEARGLQLQATRRPNPTIGYQAQEVGNDGAFGQHGVFWSQTWIRGNKLALAGEVANWEVQRRGWEFQVERYRIANLVRERYYNLLAARRVSDVSALIHEIAARNLGAVEDLFDVGEVSRNQVLQAKIELQRAELREGNAATALQRTERLLAIAVSAPNMDCHAVQGDLLAAVPELSVEEVQTWLQTESPELEAARADIERARWKIEREVVRPVPNVNTQLGLLYDDSSNNAFGNFQVSWQIPKFNCNTGNIQAAQADSRRAQFALEELQLSLQSRVQQTFQQYEVATQRVDSYEARVLPMAKDNLKITREAYKIGKASYQTLLTAQRSYFDALLTLIESRRLLWLSVARIQGLVIPE